MATIIKTVGASGRDYTTIAAALASIPTDIVASGNAYVIELDKNVVYPQTTIAGFTCDPTHNITIRPIAGHGFRDQPDFLVAPYRYDKTRGVAFEATVAYSALITINTDDVVIEGIQAYSKGGDCMTIVGNGKRLIIRNNILMNEPGNAKKVIGNNGNDATTPVKIYNNLIVVPSGTGSGIHCEFATEIYNNTIVCLGDGTSRIGINAPWYSPVTMSNNAIFGFAEAIRNEGNTAYGSNNATSAASFTEAGTNSLTNLVFADQFKNITLATADFRLKPTSALRNAGATVALASTSTNNQPRATTGTAYDIGAWEYVATPKNLVRYIRDTMASGGTSEGIWTEIKAFTADNTNVALGKTVTANVVPPDGNQVLPRITDGITSARGNDAYYADFWNKPGCAVTVDLGQVYDLTKVTIWHYFMPWTLNTKWDVSADGVEWTTVWNYATDGTYAEDEINGHSVSLSATTVPDAPTNVVATAGDGSVSVAFTAPVNNGGAAITSYTVTLSTGQTATGATSPITVNATNGTPTTATVKATNSVGTSAASAPSNSVTPVLDNTAPFLVSATTNTAGTEIILTFSETLAATIPATTAFQYIGHTIGGITITGADVKLTGITPTINGGETVAISYTKPTTNALTDTAPAANQVASFGPVSVANATPYRPVLPGYIVKVYGDSDIADFTTPDALQTYINSLNCVTLASKVMIYLDKNLNATSKGFRPAGANESYFVTIRPMPGKSFDELEADAAPGAIGTLGIEMIANDFGWSQGVLLEALRIRGSGTGGTAALNQERGNAPGDTPGGMHACRVIMTGTAPTLVGGWSGSSALFSDNLFVVDAANTYHIANNQGSLRFQRNTFVRLNGAIGTAAINHAYNARDDFDNVFAGCGSAPYTNTTAGAVNNFTDTPLAAASAVIAYVSGPFFESATDYRPAAGSGLLGVGSRFAISVNDNNGNNRGLLPDPGAFQRTPAIPLPVGSVTSQVLDGQSLIVNISTSRAPTAGTIVLLPADPANGAQTTGPVALVLGTNTASVTVDDIPPGDYLAPVITLSNAGGSNVVSGTTPISIMGIDNLLYDTGGVGVGGGGTDPTLPAPVVAIATADANIMSGKRATLSGSVSLQGDTTGTVEVFIDPQPTGTPVSAGQANVANGTWTKQFDLAPGLYKIRVVATANNQVTTVTTGAIRVLNLIGNFSLPG